MGQPAGQVSTVLCAGRPQHRGAGLDYWEVPRGVGEEEGSPTGTEAHQSGFPLPNPSLPAFPALAPHLIQDRHLHMPAELSETQLLSKPYGMAGLGLQVFPSLDCDV